MFKNASKREIYLHIVFCCLFLVVPILVSTRPPGEPFLTITKPFLRDLAGSLLLLVFVYLNYYYFIPSVYFRKKYLLYGSIIFLSLLIICFAPALITGRSFSAPAERSFPGGLRLGTVPPPPPHSLSEFFMVEIRHHIYLFLIAVFFTILLRIQQRLAAVRQENLSAALTSLKAQINPHFLFNTLNSIYALSVKKDDKAADAIIDLSGLMRYVISDANDHKITLQKELNYIRNYIGLQQARLGDTVTIHFSVVGEPAKLSILPLILMTYIENAFKYGVNPDDENCEVFVKIEINHTELTLSVLNKKLRLTAPLESTGIGIKNTSERLMLLYPDKHRLEVREDDTTYAVTLSLSLA